MLLVLTTLASCWEKNSDSLAPATNRSITTPKGIEGNWASGCVSGQEFKIVITPTTFRLSQKDFTTRTCDVGTEQRIYIIDNTYSYDKNAKLADLVMTRGYAAFWNATRLSELNDGDDNSVICGPKDWQAGVIKDIMDMTPCDTGSAITGDMTQYSLHISGPDSLVLAGALPFTRE